MAEEIAVENGRICNFEVLVTLTLDRVILHTIVHHSSTSTYQPNFIQIVKLFVDRRTHVRIKTQIWMAVSATQLHYIKDGVASKLNSDIAGSRQFQL